MRWAEGKIPPRPIFRNGVVVGPTLVATDEALVAGFYALKARRDVADLLELRHDHLVYHLFRMPVPSRYTQFQIPKRNGLELRTIRAPATALKLIQRKLNRVLKLVYERQYGFKRPSVHGFREKRGIVTNAAQHRRRPWVLRVDLKDFFHAISFPRVYGLFAKPPFALPKEAAATLSQICCFENVLPQGAPTSPTVSNLICSRMDGELQRLAGRHRGVHYTRYADDLVFSSWRPFPEALAVTTPQGIRLGLEVAKILKGNWFEPSEEKLRLFTPSGRRLVTGLLVNRRVNVQRKFVRRVRSMLRLWRKHGLESMQAKSESESASQTRSEIRRCRSFVAVVRGRIEFIGQVRGKRDRVYLRLLWQYQQLVSGRPADATLDYVTKLLGEGRGDARDQIERCYAVKEAVEQQLLREGVSIAALAVPTKRVRLLGLLANGTPIVGTRHPGNFKQVELREMTAAELATIHEVAHEIRDAYANHLQARAERPSPPSTPGLHGS